ncbi:peptidase M23 [Psychromonas sp. PRT-SC03]|nr:peptidase M23 [Psychromonas sp. PRT-SC03]
MSITVIYSREKTDLLFSLTKNKLLLLCVFFSAFVLATIWLIQDHYQGQFNAFKVNSMQKKEADKDKYLHLIKMQTDEKLQLLIQKISLLQTQLQHLNALGLRVIEKSNLPSKEFNFAKQVSNNPKSIVTPKSTFLQLLNKIETLDIDLKNKKNQLTFIEIALDKHHVLNQLYISGRPVKGYGSWLSSPFGVCKDPFSGKFRLHKGVDVAGFTGMPIIATAAGVVTYSGPRSGYGLMVEINHGKGLVTRYAHAKLLLVKIGDVVKKGQNIAVMGSTGRSTGPHVHYEVLKRNKRINPNYYLRRKVN